MKIEGAYKTDNNFTTVFTDDTIYTIASNGEWGSISVGNATYMGDVLDQKWFDEMKAECKKYGTFELK